MNGSSLVMFVGASALGLSALAMLGAAQQSGVSSQNGIMEVGMEFLKNVIARTSEHEGSYDALNLNTDGAGLSFGILQWAQITGGLGILLRAMYQKDSQRFRNTFGVRTQELLRVAEKGSLEAVEGAVLWREPWVTRFRTAGRDPVFRAVQDHEALHSEQMRVAFKSAGLLGFTTERSLSFFFERANQQGPNRAVSIAKKVRQLLAGRQVTHVETLKTATGVAAAPFRTLVEPQKPFPSKHIRWVKVGAKEWHAFAGKVDLYRDVTRLALGVVNNPHLKDEPIRLSPEVRV